MKITKTTSSGRGSEESWTGKTEDWTAKTTSHRHYQPSRMALAARSLTAVERIADPTERRAALFAHFEQFPPAAGSFCPPH